MSVAPATSELSLGARLSILLIAPLSGLAQSGLSPVLPRISEHFAGQPGADAMVRMLATAVPAAMILGSLMAGFIASRYGQRRTLLWMLAGFTLAGCSGFLIENLAALLASRVLLGIFTAAAGVVATGIIATRIAERLRDSWLGYLAVAGTFGAIIILLIAGALGAESWRSVFLLHGIAIPVLALIALLLPGDEVITQRRSASTSAPVPLFLIAVGLVTGGITATAVVFLPYHLAEIGQADPRRIALAMIPNAVVGGLVAFAFGAIRRRVSNSWIFVIGFGLAAVGLLSTVGMGNFVGALCGMALVGAATSLLGPNAMAAAAQVAAPEHRTQVIGYIRAGFYSGPIVAQLALESVSATHGAAGALLTMSAVAVLMLVAARVGSRRLSLA